MVDGLQESKLMSGKADNATDVKWHILHIPRIPAGFNAFRTGQVASIY